MDPTCPPEHLLRVLRRPRWFQLRVLKAKERSAVRYTRVAGRRFEGLWR